ncbi:hybrid sensor histidine kinase/response regulator [Methylobacterium crusticola]|nr:PAS domain-containing protein [Methylobacterium crusticola]
MRAHDWSASPLGPPESWPAPLQMTVSLMLGSAFPMFVAWGPGLGFLYNDAYIDVLGRKHPSALGGRFREIWEEIWSDVEPLVQRAMAGEATFSEDLPLRMQRKGFEEDTWFTFSYSPVREQDGTVGGMFCACTETTARVRAQAELQRREHELRALNATLEEQDTERTAQLKLYADIIQASAAPICAFDTGFRLIAFNQAHSDEFYRIFGHRVQLGEVFPDLFPPDQAPVIRGFMTRALAGETYIVTEEFGDPTLAKPYWEVSYAPLRDAGGGIVGAFHYARDISARLRAEAELAATQDTLRQSQKLESIGQLTGGVAHDFNNLLTVIRSSADLLKRPDLPSARRERYIAAISDTVDRASKLTAQLLAFARRQALQPKVFDACESVRALSDMMVTLIGSRIGIVTDLPAQACSVNADPSQFDTALVNMAVNARDAMGGEGRLTISVRVVDAMPAVRAHPAAQGPFVAVAISDTGSGIPEEHLAQIFEPFFTTKVIGQGTGLGLSQVFGFTKQSGGEVLVESVLGQGTTFTLYLPRALDAVQAASGLEPEPLIDGHGTYVLVVEDNAAVGTFAVQTLNDLGYQSVLTSNALEALAELTKDADRFDVVFSDVVMPGMDGIELARRIRDAYPGLPVLLASGYSHVLAQTGTAGFDLLHKPYSIEQLSRLLRKVANPPRRDPSRSGRRADAPR